MALGQSPTLRRRRLGAVLREMREHAEITRDEVGERLDCSASKIARIEIGDVGVRRRDLDDMLELYGVTDDLARRELAELARQSKERGGWWQKYGDLPNPYLTLIELESVANSISSFQLMVVPGLLQTEEYARAVIKASRPSDSVEEVERRVKVRLTRQELLVRPESPALWAVLDEAALRRVVGSSAVMRDQLGRLLDLGDRPNLTIQVLPFTCGGYEALFGGFMLLRFPDPDPDVVYVEGFAGDVYLEKEEELVRCSLAFERLCDAALSQARSAELIRSAARDLP
jgi:transcriptional regulator with XRE-family HTH domain